MQGALLMYLQNYFHEIINATIIICVYISTFSTYLFCDIIKSCNVVIYFSVLQKNDQNKNKIKFILGLFQRQIFTYKMGIKGIKLLTRFC